MARTRRSRGGLDKAVSRTVKRVSTTARRRANTGGGDLVKAVQGLVKALPLGELEKRLSGLEESVSRLEGGIRKAGGRVVGGAAKRAGAAKRRTTRKATSAKRTTTRRAGTAKRGGARKAAAKRTTTRR